MVKEALSQHDKWVRGDKGAINCRHEILGVFFNDPEVDRSRLVSIGLPKILETLDWFACVEGGLVKNVFLQHFRSQAGWRVVERWADHDG